MAPHDTFTHNGKVYDLSKTRILLRNQEPFELPLKDLTWVLRYDTPDEDRVTKAKHRYPLIVAKWNGRWTVVDGLHRLEKYRRLGVKSVPVKEATASILKEAEFHAPELLTHCLSVRFPFLNNVFGLSESFSNVSE